MSVLEIAIFLVLHIIAVGFLLSLVLNDEQYSKLYSVSIGIGIAINAVGVIKMFYRLWQLSN